MKALDLQSIDTVLDNLTFGMGGSIHKENQGLLTEAGTASAQMEKPEKHPLAACGTPAPYRHSEGASLIHRLSDIKCQNRPKFCFQAAVTQGKYEYLYMCLSTRWAILAKGCDCINTSFFLLTELAEMTRYCQVSQINAQQHICLSTEWGEVTFQLIHFYLR